MKYRKTLIIVSLFPAVLGISSEAQTPNAPSMMVPPDRLHGPSEPNVSGSQKVEFNKLPSQVQSAIHSQSGSSGVASVTRETWKGTAYQAAFEQNGKIVQLQFASDGTLLNNNASHAIRTSLSGTKPVTYEQLPGPVQSALSQYAGTQSVKSLHQGTFSAPVYQANLKNGQQLLVAQDGSLLQQSTLSEAAGAATSGSRAFKDLPWAVQKSMLDRSGWATIPTVNQSTLPDGRTAYSGMYQKQGKNYQITVDQNGNVISDKSAGQ